VQEHVEGQPRVDVLALAENIAESLVDLVLLAPEQERAKLLAAAIAHGARTPRRCWSDSTSSFGR